MQKQNESLSLLEESRDDFRNELLLIYEIKCCLFNQEKPEALWIEDEFFEIYWDTEEIEVYGNQFIYQFVYLENEIIDYKVESL